MPAEMMAAVLRGAMPWTVVDGDSTAVLKHLPDGCVDAVVSDPPSGTGFMSAPWDRDKGGRDQWIAWLAGIMAEARRCTTPGGHALVWALPRTSHWTGMALEQGGWQVRDVITHHFGCLSEDTEILTEHGWEPYHRLVAGKHVLAYNVDNSSYQWQPIEELFIYAYSDTAFRLRSDHADQLVSRNHRCLVERGGSYVFQQAETLERQARVPLVEDLPALLATLPLPHQGTSGAQQDVLTDLQGACTKPCAGGATAKASEDGGLCAVRQGVRAEERRQERGVLQPVVQRSGQSADGQAAQRQHEGAQAQGPAIRTRQSGVEGRSHLLQDAWQLCRRQVRALSRCLSGHGPQGRLRHGASLAGGSGAWPIVTEDGGGTPHRPQPREQCLEQPAPLQQQPGAQVVRGAGYTRTDLVTVEPVHYDGTVWCVRVASGAFVARRHGKAFVTGNSGFPKSRSLLKPASEHWILCRAPGPLQPLQIDACRVATSDVGAPRAYEPREDREQWRITGGSNGSGATSPAGRWPANVLFSHVGGPDGCRPAGVRRVRGSRIDKPCDYRGEAGAFGHGGARPARGIGDADGYEEVSAWACVDGCPIKALDEQAGPRTSGAKALHHVRTTTKGKTAWGTGQGGGILHAPPEEYAGSTGAASRFFPTFAPDPEDAVPFRYVPKASRRERNAGCEALSAREVDRYGECGQGSTPQQTPRVTRLEGNHHPTVKPVSLARWLARLVCPPSGVILDPFAGSGALGVGAILEGFRYIGVEMDPAYADIARARLAWATQQQEMADAV